jgi:NADH:ubiquinone oxidoreductase subunit D
LAGVQVVRWDRRGTKPVGEYSESLFDVRSFRGADCDTEHYLVVAEVRERLAVSKQTTHKFHVERFNLKKLNEVEGKEQYWVEISNRFAALENLDDDVGINRVWKTIRENINISAEESLGYYELKKHKPWKALVNTVINFRVP